MKPVRFVVIFQPLAKIHLTKDVGGIPVAFSKFWGIDHHFIGGSLTPKGKKYTSALFCGVSSKIIQRLGFLYTVARMVQSGDIINIYHLSPLSFITIMIMRLFHGDRIKIYLKLDMGTREKSLRIARIIAGTAIESSTRDFFTKIVGLWICRHVDVISAESSRVFSITSLWPSKVMLKIPNGFFEEEYPLIRETIDTERINRFISVARHGSEPKRSEELLEAFSIANLPSDWTLSLVGEYTQEFKRLLDETIRNSPNLKDKIVLHGPIHDRNELMAMLSSSKVFTAVSLYEGFSLALLEAAACGCYCVSTDTGGASDVICEDGIILGENASTLDIAVALERAVSSAAYFNHLRFANEIAHKFSWKTVLTPLADALQIQYSEIKMADSTLL